jgi:hypothetical protein
MLAITAQRQGDYQNISGQQADASALPFEDAAFDVVCCQFDAMLARQALLQGSDSGVTGTALPGATFDAHS